MKNVIEKDLVIGLHSIVEAIKNSSRYDKVLYGTNEGLNKLYKNYDSLPLGEVEIQTLSSNSFLKKTQALYAQKNFDYSRIPSGLLLQSTALKILTPQWIFENLSNKSLKIIALDSVTDIHNGAAIMRTAAFFGVDAFVISQKGSFGLVPSFYRMASGATESIKIIKTSNLSKLIKGLQERGVCCIGLSEHSSESEFSELEEINCCLVLGNEETGISHAVIRSLNRTFALRPKGCIKSLNVSVAAAIAMEKFFNER